MTTPKPKLDLFNDSPFLVSKKCRTSTPSLRPPKPPIKSSKHLRRSNNNSFNIIPLDSQFEFINDNNNISLPPFVFQQNNNISNISNNNNNNNNIDNNINNNSNNFNNNNNFNSTINNIDEEFFLPNQFDSSTSSDQEQPNHIDIITDNQNDLNYDNSILKFNCNQQQEQQQVGADCNNISRLSQQFEIQSKIGSGYFADVYKAKSLLDNQYYAIKKTSIPYTSKSDRLRKLQEVKNHQSIPPHPNCVKYYDSWEEDGYLYIQTELCKISLNEVLETSEEHKLPEHLVWSYLYDLLLAVKHLHDHQLLHLDIKPDNIFISFDGVAKLGDFGLMCNCLDLNSSQNQLVSFSNDHDDSGITNRSEESIDSLDEGDSKYLASETMQGKFTKAADIFCLGITMFEVASGLDLPQRGEVYHKLRHNEIEDLYFNGLSADLVKIIRMMMEEDYTKRPSVDELLPFIRPPQIRSPSSSS